MDNNKAKLLLAVYRRSGEDAQDPFFAEALQQADKDPALRDWLAQEQAFDGRFAAALGEIHGPKEGRALIEATMMRRPSRQVRWRPFALAASIAVIFALYFSFGRTRAFPLPETASAAELAKHLAEHDSSIGLMSGSYAEIRKWLAEKGGPAPERLPPGLAQLGVMACQTWNTERGKVSLVCFVRDNKEMIHLYVFENLRAGTPAPDMSAPRYERSGQWAFAVWQDGARTYALGATGDQRAEDTLRRLFRA